MKKKWLNNLILWFEDNILQRQDPEFEHKKFLLKIKYFLENKNPKLYNPINNNITVDFAEIIFDFYRYSGLLKKSLGLNEWDNLEKLMEILVNAQLKPFQKKLLDQFKPYYLMQIFNQSGLSGLNNFIFSSLSRFEKSLNDFQRNEINNKFSRFFELTRLIDFDFSYLLSYLMKTKSSVKEKYKEKSNFQFIDFKENNADDFIDKLELLSHLIYSMDLYGDFHESVRVLGKIKGNQVMPNYELTQIIQHLQFLVRDNYLAFIIGYVKKNPYFRPIQDRKNLPIINKYLESLRWKIDEYKTEVLKQTQENKYHQLLHKLFTIDQITPLKYYNAKYKNRLNIFKIEGFKYTYLLSCLNHFLLNKYVNHIIKSLKWLNGKLINTSLENQLTYSCSISQNLLKQIINLDTFISKSDNNQSSIAKLLQCSQINASIQDFLVKTIKLIDQQAENILLNAYQSFQRLQFFLKALINDYQNQSSYVVKDLQNIPQYQKWGNQWIYSYNDITRFLSLLKIFIKTKKQLKLV